MRTSRTGALVAAASLVLAACGGSSSSGGSSRFEVRGGDNSIQRFGSEASPRELDRAAAALHGYLDARAVGAWGTACSYMARGLVRSISQLAGAKEATCLKPLATLSAGVPPKALREAAIADVGILRIKGARAFLLFRGAQGAAYFMPMVHEGGGWKVGALVPDPLG